MKVQQTLAQSHEKTFKALFFASEGIASQQQWQMSRAFLSPCYTTRLNDIIKVK